MIWRMVMESKSFFVFNCIKMVGMKVGEYEKLIFIFICQLLLTMTIIWLISETAWLGEGTLWKLPILLCAALSIGRITQKSGGGHPRPFVGYRGKAFFWYIKIDLNDHLVIECLIWFYRIDTLAPVACGHSQSHCGKYSVTLVSDHINIWTTNKLYRTLNTCIMEESYRYTYSEKNKHMFYNLTFDFI